MGSTPTLGTIIPAEACFARLPVHPEESKRVVSFLCSRLDPGSGRDPPGTDSEKRSERTDKIPKPEFAAPEARQAQRPSVGPPSSAHDRARLSTGKSRPRPNAGTESTSLAISGSAGRRIGSKPIWSPAPLPNAASQPHPALQPRAWRRPGLGRQLRQHHRGLTARQGPKESRDLFDLGILQGCTQLTGAHHRHSFL